MNIEVVDVLMDYLGVKGVFVVIEVEYMCMSMCGVRKLGIVILMIVVCGLFEIDKDFWD